MDARLVYFDGRPSWRVAQERLRDGFDQLGRSDVSITGVLVETVEEAGGGLRGLANDLDRRLGPIPAFGPVGGRWLGVPLVSDVGGIREGSLLCRTS